jgi:hypothetical protein
MLRAIQAVLETQHGRNLSLDALHRVLAAQSAGYRTTDRMRLLDVADPVGPNNAAYILAMARESGIIVIAHGRLPGDLQKHADAMCRLLCGAGHKLHVLRLTDDGVPMHPLARGKRHIPEDVVPQLWNCQ